MQRPNRRPQGRAHTLPAPPGFGAADLAVGSTTAPVVVPVSSCTHSMYTEHERHECERRDSTSASVTILHAHCPPVLCSTYTNAQ